jgi:hypothetical protein
MGNHAGRRTGPVETTDNPERDDSKAGNNKHGPTTRQTGRPEAKRQTVGMSSRTDPEQSRW